MSKKQQTSKKPIGRPRIHLIDRKRHNLNIERNAKFDADLEAARKALAGIWGVDVSTITQTDAVRAAVSFFATTKF